MIIQATGAIIDGALRDDLWLEISDGLISSITAGKHDAPDQVVNGVLIPGFIDIHCHGGGGQYFSAASPESISAAITAHRKTGTTSLVASLVSESISDLKAQIQKLQGATPGAGASGNSEQPAGLPSNVGFLEALEKSMGR